MADRRKYTEDDRAVGLAAFAAHDNNQERTAKFLGIPRTTIQRWVNGGAVNEPTALLAAVKKGELADKLENIAHLIADAMPDKIADARLQSASIALGVAIDKMRLLREQSTSITDDNSLSDAELDRRIAALEAAEAGAASGQAEDLQPALPDTEAV